MLTADTAVLVERGWAPAPDGRTVQLSSLGEMDAAQLEGVFLPPSGTGLELDVAEGWPKFVRELDTRAIGEDYRYALLPLVLRRTGNSDSLPSAMRPVPLPELTNGPHLSYAMQWFSFATIAVIGSIVLFVRLGSEQMPAGKEELNLPN
jgi:surfeit locus 1 family protein